MENTVENKEEVIEEIKEEAIEESSIKTEDVIVENISLNDNNDNTEVITDKEAEILKEEEKKKKMPLIILLSVLLALDIAFLVIYLIGIDKVLGFVK